MSYIITIDKAYCSRPCYLLDGDDSDDDFELDVSDGLTMYTSNFVLGEGRFGKVFACRDVAVKCVDKSLILSENCLNFIQNEIDIHKTLNHKNVLKFNKMFQTRDRVYMVLDLCYICLKQLVDKSSFDENLALKTIKQIVDGLKYLHDNLVVHRDIKLENILFTKSGVIKICDFGYAVKLNSIDEKITGRVGTPDYLAPELIEKRPYSFEVDVWALGVTLYELIFSTPPFEASSNNSIFKLILIGEINFPKEISPNVPQIIKKLLIKDQEERLKLPQLIELLKN